MYIQIGSWSRSYAIIDTSAPKVYDSNSTIEVFKYEDDNGKYRRIVLISEDDLEWHRGRYASGMHDCTLLVDMEHYHESQLGEVEQKLVDRLKVAN